ncbi:hypothetical protein BGW80DRAFT_1204450 [Lactifluus volemus]|nr:hypothetical protein BGW80DRAFT_1204450 [Lactifluus volemus]
MAPARELSTTETLRTHSPNSVVNADGLAAADETSPLLQHGHTEGLGSRQIVSEERLPARSSMSSFIDNNAGMFFVVTSQFFVSGINVIVKFLNSLDEPVPILELIFIRMVSVLFPRNVCAQNYQVMTYICSVSYMYLRNVPDPFLGPKGVRTLLVSRGFTGFISLAGVYFSLQHLSLSDAMVIKFIVPILTGFSGAIFLKESLTLKEILASFASFSGVIMIARPQFLFGGLQENLFDAVAPGKRMQSIMSARHCLTSRAASLIGVLGAAGGYTLLRAIGKRAHPLHALAYFSLECVVLSSMSMMIFKIPLVIPTRVSWLVLMLLIGIFSLVAQVLLALGFQRETASRGSVALYTLIIFAVMFDFAIFHTTPTALSICGTVIIMSSAIYISLVRKTAIPPTHNPGSEQLQRVTLNTGSGDDLEAR